MKKFRNYITGFVFTGTLLCAMCMLAYAKQMDKNGDPLQPEIAGKILRFHILANSDSAQDQGIKLKIRDEIGQMMQNELVNANELSDTETVVSADLDKIKAAAERILMENGFHYGADAKLACVEFPAKTYGNYTFPEGKYKALQVTLGEGKGHNWWCVLYPNMCFQGSVYEIVDEQADEKLKEVLTPAEYADVFNRGKIKLRLKFLEYFR